jgi:lipopolysaccharide transport system permease protein
MYATPVVYPTSAMPTKFVWFLQINPLTGIFECFRYAYLGTGSFQPIDLLLSTTLIGVLFIIGIVIYNKVEKSFMDTV